MLPPEQLLLIGLAGLAAGTISGLFGVGGGILMVPAALYLVPGTDFHLAKAASLVVIVASALIGVLTHAKRQSVDLRTGLLLAAGGITGSALSVLAVERVEDRWLLAAFGLLLALTGTRLALRKQPKPRDLPPARRTTFALILGFTGGILAGAFGIGGGVIMVPGLILSGVATHLAVGTSLVAVASNSAVSTLTHLTLGYGPHLATLGIPLAIGAVPGAHLGGRLAHKLHADKLRQAFGIFLIVIGLAMSADALL